MCARVCVYIIDKIQHTEASLMRYIYIYTEKITISRSCAVRLWYIYWREETYGCMCCSFLEGMCLCLFVPVYIAMKKRACVESLIVDWKKALF